jgi:hypothetical protein
MIQETIDYCIKLVRALLGDMVLNKAVGAPSGAAVCGFEAYAVDPCAVRGTDIHSVLISAVHVFP